jgi:hypothetical protein
MRKQFWLGNRKEITRRLSYQLNDTIKIDFMEMGWEGVDSDTFWALVNTVMKLWVS